MAKKLSDIKLGHDFFDKGEYEEHLKEAAEQGRSEAAQSVIYYDDSNHITQSMFAGLDPKTTTAQVNTWVGETVASLGFAPGTKEYEDLAGQIKNAIKKATKSADSAQKVRQTGTAKGNREKRNVNLGSGQPEGVGPTTEEYHAAAHADLLKQYDNHIASNPLSDAERAILHQYGHAHDGSWTVIRRKPTKSQAEYDALADPSKSKTDEASPESGYTPGQLRAMMTAPPIRTRSSDRSVLDPDPGGAIGEELYAVRRRVSIDDQGNATPYDEVFRAVRQKTQQGFAGPFMPPDALSVSSADKAESEVQGISNKAISTREVPSLHSPLLYQDKYPARTVAGRLESGRGAVLATGNKLRDARSAFRQLTQGTGEGSLAGMASKAINAGPTATFENGHVKSGFGMEQFGEGFAHSLSLLAQELGFRLDENAPIPRLDEVLAPLPEGASLDLINSRAQKLADYNRWIKSLAKQAAEVTDSRFQSATTVEGPDGFPTGGVTHADVHDALNRYVRQYAKPGNFLHSRHLYMPGFPIKYKLSTRTGEARVLSTYQDRPKLDDDGKFMKDGDGNFVMERVTVLPPKMSSFGPTAGKYGMAHGQVPGSSDPARPSDRSENVDVSFAPDAFHEQDSAQRVINVMNTFNSLMTKMSTAVTQAKRELTAAANEHASASRKLARDLDVFTTLEGIEPWDPESEARAAATGGRLPPRPVAVEQLPGTRDPATGQEIARTVRPEQVIGDAYGRNYSRSRLTAESTPNDFVSVGEDAALSAINADAALGDEIESKNIQGVDEATADEDFNSGRQATDETGDMAVGDPANDMKQELLRRIFGPEDTSGYNDEVIRKALADLKEGEVLTADHLARAKVGVQPAGTNGIVLDKDNLNAQMDMALIDPSDTEALNKAVENAIAQTTRLTAHEPIDHRLNAQRMVTVSRPAEKPGRGRQFQGVPDLLPLSPGDPEKGIEPRYLAGGFAEGRSGKELPYHEQVLEELRAKARAERGTDTSEDLQGDLDQIEADIAQLSESHRKAGDIQEDVASRAEPSEDDLLAQDQAEEDKEVAKGNVAATPLVRGEDLLPSMSSSDEAETSDFATPMRHIYGIPREVPEADTRTVGDEMAEAQARLEENRARLKADAPSLHSLIEAHLTDREAKKKAHAEAYAEWQQKDAAAREAEAAAQPKNTVVPIGGQRIASDPALAEAARAARAEANAAKPKPVTHESEHTEKLAALLNGEGPSEIHSLEGVAAKLGVDLSSSGAAGHRAVRKLYDLLNVHEQGSLKGRRRSKVLPEAVGQALLDIHDTAPDPSGSRLYDPSDPNLGKPAAVDPSKIQSTSDLTLAEDQSEAEWKRQWGELTTVKYPTKPKTDSTGKVISSPEVHTRRRSGPRGPSPKLTPVREYHQGGDLTSLSNVAHTRLLGEIDAGSDESVKLAQRLGKIQGHATRYAGALKKGQVDKLKDPVTGKLMSVLEFINHRISTDTDSPEAAAERREAVREQGKELRADEGKLKDALNLHNTKFADLQDKHEEVKEKLEIAQEVHDEHKEQLEGIVKSLRNNHGLLFIQGHDPISAEQADEMNSSLNDEASMLRQRGIDPDSSDHELAAAHRQRRNMVNLVQALYTERGVVKAAAENLGKLQRSEANRAKELKSHKYYDPNNNRAVNEFRERWAKKQRTQENKQAQIVGKATPLIPMPEEPVGGYASDEQKLQHHDEHLHQYLDDLSRSVTALGTAYVGSRAKALDEARYQTEQDAKEEQFNTKLDLFHPGETIPEISKKIMADPEAKRVAVGANGEINIRAYNEHKFKQAFPHTDPKHQHLYSMTEDGTPVLNFERILMDKTPEAKARVANFQYDPFGTSTPAPPPTQSTEFPPDHPIHASRAAAAIETRRTLAGVLQEAMTMARDVAQRTLVSTDQGIQAERRRGTVTYADTGKQTTLGAAVDSEIEESEKVRQANERAKALRENPLGTGEAATIPLTTGRGSRSRGKRGAPGQGSEVFILPPVEETPPPPTPGINKLIRDQEAGAPIPGRPPSGGKTGRPARPTAVSGIDPTWLDARNVDALGARRLDAEGVQIMADRYHQYRSDLHKASIEEYQNYGVKNVGLDSSPAMPHIDEHPAVAKALGDLHAHEAAMASVAGEHQRTYQQLYDTAKNVQLQVSDENPGIDPELLRAHPAVADAIGQLHAHLSVMNDMESKRNALATEVDQARLQAQAERQSSTIPVKAPSSPKVAVAREMLRAHEENIRDLHPVDRNNVLAAINSVRPTAVYSERSDRQTRPILDRVEDQQQVDATIQAASRLTRPKDPVTKALLPNRPWTSVDTLGIGGRGQQFRGGPEIITEPASPTQRARAGVLRDVGVRMAQEGAGLATGENSAGIQEGGFRTTEVPLERASEIMRPYRIAAHLGLTGPDIRSVPMDELRPSVSVAMDRAAGRTPALRAAGVPRGLASELAGGFLDPTSGSGSAPSEPAEAPVEPAAPVTKAPEPPKENPNMGVQFRAPE